MTRATLIRAANHATAAAAALVPAAAGGKDSDGRQVVDLAEAVRRAREELREALRELEEGA